MKKRVWRISLAVMLSIALLAAAVSFIFDKERIAFIEEVDPARLENCIEGYAAPKKFGYFVADLVDYEVVIVHCDNFKINTERLKRAMNVEPFDVVGEPRISRKSFDSKISKVVLTQTLQAVDVFPGEEYKFGDIPVEYFNEDQGTDHIYWVKNIKPVYVSRVASEDSVRSYYKNPEVLNFRPTKSKILESESRVFNAALVLIGSLLVLFSTVELVFLLKPKRVKKIREGFGRFGHVLERIQQIEHEAKNGPRHALHQLYNLIATIADEFPDLAEKIQGITVSTETKAYSKNEPALSDIEQEIRDLRNLLKDDFKDLSNSRKRGGDA